MSIRFHAGARVRFTENALGTARITAALAKIGLDARVAPFIKPFAATRAAKSQVGNYRRAR